MNKIYIRFDTIKFQVDLNDCQLPTEKIFTKYYRSRPTKAKYLVDVCKPCLFGFYGLNYIKIDNERQTVFIEISSKILGNYYHQLLHRGNIYQALDLINATGLVTIPPEALATAITSFVTVTSDKRLARPTKETNRIIKSIHVPNKFKVNSYGKEGKHTYQTLHFIPNFVSDKNTTVFKSYDKDYEFSRKENENFRLSLQNSQALLKYFKGKTRFEKDFKTMKEIKKGFKLSSHKPLLLDVLESSGNPLLDGWNEILNDFQQAQPITIEPTSKNQYKMNAYKIFITQLEPAEASAFAELMMYNFELDNIELYIKSMYPRASQKNTWTTKRKQYRAVLCKWQQFQNQINSIDFSVLAEIKEALHYQASIEPMSV